MFMISSYPKENDMDRKLVLYDDMYLKLELYDGYNEDTICSCIPIGGLQIYDLDEYEDSISKLEITLASRWLKYWGVIKSAALVSKIGGEFDLGVPISYSYEFSELRGGLNFKIVLKYE